MTTFFRRNWSLISKRDIYIETNIRRVAEAVILVPKARGNLRLARANQGSLLYGYFSLSAKPPEGCGGEKLCTFGRIRTYILQHDPTG